MLIVFLTPKIRMEITPRYHNTWWIQLFSIQAWLTGLLCGGRLIWISMEKSLCQQPRDGHTLMVTMHRWECNYCGIPCVGTDACNEICQPLWAYVPIQKDHKMIQYKFKIVTNPFSLIRTVFELLFERQSFWHAKPWLCLFWNVTLLCLFLSV